METQESDCTACWLTMPRRFQTWNPLHRWVVYHPPRLTGTQCGRSAGPRARTVGETALLLCRSVHALPRRAVQNAGPVLLVRQITNFPPALFYSTRPLPIYFSFTWCVFFFCWWAVVVPSVSPPSHREETRRGLEKRKWWGVQDPPKNECVVKMMAPHHACAWLVFIPHLPNLHLQRD